MSGKQFMKFLAVAGGLVGYSYVVHKVSFWGGRFVGWYDAAKVIVEAAKDKEKKDCDTTEKTE